MVAVLQDVREFHVRFSTVKSADPVEKIFAALDISIEFYIGDPVFYRTLWAAVFDTSDGVREEILNPKRDAFWRALLVEAADAGAIATDIDLDQLQRQLELMLRSALFAWVVGEVSSERLGWLARLGYGLILSGAASPDWRGPLRARVIASQEALEPTN